MTLPDQFDHSSTSLATFCDKTNLFEGISPIKKPKSIPKPSVKRKRMVIEDDDDDDDDDDDGDVQDSPFSHLMADVPTKPLTIATKGSSKPSTFLIGNLDLFACRRILLCCSASVFGTSTNARSRCILSFILPMSKLFSPVMSTSPVSQMLIYLLLITYFLS